MGVARHVQNFYPRATVDGGGEAYVSFDRLTIRARPALTSDQTDSREFVVVRTTRPGNVKGSLFLPAEKAPRPATQKTG